MGADLDQIVAKLTAPELDLLQDRFGVNLRDSRVVETFEAFEQTRRRIRAIEEKALRKIRKERGERPHCSFCGGTPEQVGMLCESSLGPYICASCAQSVIELIDAEKQRDA
jgi:hypothetical protein